MITELIQGLVRGEERRMEGGFAGLKGLAPTLTQEMRASPAHGDQTGASHASYSARAVGLGENGSGELAAARAAAAVFNPDHVVAGEGVVIDGVMGIIFDDPMDYGPDRETAGAGERAVEGPTVTASGGRCTQAVASGMKRAMGG